MQNWLTAQTIAQPDGIALIADGQTWTFRALNEAAQRLAGWLVAEGIEKGDRVAALMPNCAEAILLIHAVAKIGAVLVPLNTRQTAAEWRTPLHITAARVLIAHPETQITAEQLSDVARVLPINLDYPDPLVAEVEIDLDALQAIIFTSGTTGQPKGAALTFGNQWYGAWASAARIGTLPADRWLCPLPLYHVGGLALVLRCCLYGITVVLERGASVEGLTASIETNGATLVSLVPTMLYRMLGEDRAVAALQRLRLVLLGGAAASPDLLEQCARLGIAVAPTYGLSEACSQVATMLPTDSQRKPGSVGKPLLFSQVEILDEHDQPQPPGVYGEVVITGATVMQGYYNQPDATAKTLRGGKLHTGDIGYLDQDGDLYLVQRRSDLIVSGGENIYPVEVENALLKHPAIAAACVVGIPSAEWGQQAAAAVVLKLETSATEAELRAFCRESLAGYKIPKVFKFVDELPQNATGKVQRRAVAELFAAMWDESANSNVRGAGLKPPR
jgi:O-succinylbenzoic acid--CoA ligase